MKGNMIRRLLALIRMEISRRLADRWSIPLILSLPLIFGGMMTMIVGGDVRPTGQLLIVDHDESFLSRAMPNVYSGGELGEIFQVSTIDDESAARARLAAGEASAALILPDGFGQALLDGSAAEVILLTNPAQRILPGIAEEVTTGLLELAHYARRLLEPQIELLRGLDESPDDAFVAALSVDIRRQVERVEGRLFPPALDVEVIEAEAESNGPGLGELFYPAILIMALVFAAQHLAVDLWSERESGTIRRLAAAPLSWPLWLSARLLVALVLFAVIAFLVSTLYFAWFDWNWWLLPPALVWALAAGVPLFAIMLLLCQSAGSRRAADVLTMVVLIPGLILGGSFFPFAAMPDGMAALGRWLPNGIAADRLNALMFDSATVTDLLAPGAALLASGLLLLLIIAWRMPAFARGRGGQQ